MFEKYINALYEPGILGLVSTKHFQLIFFNSKLSKLNTI